MTADDAAKAHRRSVAINMASAIRSLYAHDHPTLSEAREVAEAEEAALAADKELAEWRERHSR
jgi:hypothetical protein